MTTTLLTAATATTTAGSTQLVLAALVGIAVIVLLITQLKLHPFLSLTIGSIAVGVLAGVHLDDTLTSFGKGVGATVASVGSRWPLRRGRPTCPCKLKGRSRQD